jgi:hypothetical protein
LHLHGCVSVSVTVGEEEGEEKRNGEGVGGEEKRSTEKRVVKREESW